jgi:phage I-like protein
MRSRVRNHHQEDSHVRALNAKAAGGETAVRAFCFAIPQGDAAPEWVPYLPPPDAQGRITGEDGRWWTVKNPRALCTAVRRKLPIDINHSSELAAKVGGEAPAVGWMQEFQVREDGSTWARVDWNERGANAVKGKEYAFVSPTFDFSSTTREIKRFVSAGLTNEPNLALPALNSAGHLEENPMLERLLALLGLTANATEEEASRAINKMKSELERATNASNSPPLDKFVPRADHDAVLQRATNAETALQTEKQRQHDAVADAEITAALAAGKITPATKEYHRASCSTEAGLKAFRDYVKVTPVVVKPGEQVQGQPNPADLDANGLTEVQRAICARTGVTPEAFAATLKTQRASA